MLHVNELSWKVIFEINAVEKAAFNVEQAQAVKNVVRLNAKNLILYF